MHSWQCNELHSAFGFQFDSSGASAQCVDFQAKKPEACGKLKYMLPLHKLV